MKTKIKVKVLTQGCMPTITTNGDWIDLRSATELELEAPQSGVLKKKTVDNKTVSYRNVMFDIHYIPLGIAVELPDGYEALINSRSSSPYKFKLFIPSGQGVVDNSYNGNNDEWHYVCSTLNKATIHKGDRICQFRIQLSQKATLWQKIKWLFSSGIELVEVSELNNPDRNGLGSTGVN